MEYTNKTRTITSFMRDIDEGRLFFNHKVQRKSGQWSKSQRSRLIYSLCSGFLPIPPIHIAELDGKEYVIDGKQRLETIHDYINDKFKLLKGTDKVTSIHGEEYELTNKKWSQLPDDIKNKLLETEILQVKYVDYTDNQIAQIFSVLNNGSPLTADQKLRAVLDFDSLDLIDKVLSSGFFERLNLSNNQIIKGQDLTLVLQAAMLISKEPFNNFGSKSVLHFAENINKEALNAISNNIDELDFKFIDNPNIKKVSIPMVLAGAAIAPNLDNYVKNLDAFFNDSNDQEVYREYCQKATSAKANVMGRWEMIKRLSK